MAGSGSPRSSRHGSRRGSRHDSPRNSARSHFRRLALSKVYALLEPGPVLLLTTFHKGKANVMTMSWQTPMDFEPPLVGCVISNRDFSFTALKASRECVLAVPDAAMASKVVACGNHSGSTVDKFVRFGLTPQPAALVAAPLIAECFANLECRVVDTRFVNRYSFFVLEVVTAWVERGNTEPQTLHHRGKGLFMLSGENIRLPSKMK